MLLARAFCTFLTPLAVLVYQSTTPGLQVWMPLPRARGGAMVKALPVPSARHIDASEFSAARLREAPEKLIDVIGLGVKGASHPPPRARFPSDAPEESFTADPNPSRNHDRHRGPLAHRN